MKAISINSIVPLAIGRQFPLLSVTQDPTSTELGSLVTNVHSRCGSKILAGRPTTRKIGLTWTAKLTILNSSGVAYLIGSNRRCSDAYVFAIILLRME
jgi:hypothetical protein